MTDKKPQRFEAVTFWEYFSTVFVPLNQLQLPLKEFHRSICETLEAAVLGSLGKPYVVINMPPRVGKTKILQALGCWMLANFPDAQMIYTGYSSMLAEQSTRYMREVLASDWHRKLFPMVKLGSVQQADMFTTASGGCVYGAGVGGTLTGIGAGLKRPAGGFIAIDDASKPEEAMSAVESDKLWFWFENTLVRRRNSSEWCPVIVCAQRLAVDDLCGRILEQYPNRVVHVKFPGMVNGESIIPETLTTQDMEDTKRANPFAFSAQIQQEPVMLGGNIIHTNDFMYYAQGEVPKLDRKVIVVDTAIKAKEWNDFSVMQCWGKAGKHAFLLDQVRGRWESPELMTMAREFYAKHNTPDGWVSRFLIEDASAGASMLQEFQRAGIPAWPVKRDKDKVSRVNDILPFIVTHMVYIPKDAPWLPDFLTECARFRKDGKSAHDDIVDCLADGIFYTLGKPLSILEVLGTPKGTYHH